MSEFVITRKRRRPRIVIEETDSQGVGSLCLPALNAHRSNTPINMIPEIAVLPQLTPSSGVMEPARSESPPVGSAITIEKFLRQSVETPPRTSRTYRRTILSVPQKSAYMRTKEAPDPRRKRVEIALVGQQKRAKTKKGKKVTRLAESLSRAAILAHGDPSDCLMDIDSRSCTRRPLTFEPLNKFSALSSRDNLLGSNTSVRDSLTGSYNPSCTKPPVSFPKQTALKNAHQRKTRKVTSNGGRLPLKFIPLQQAEAAYSLKFPRSTVSGSRKLRKKTVQAVSTNKPETAHTALNVSPIHSNTPNATDRQGPNSFDVISSPADALPELPRSPCPQPHAHLFQASENNARMEASSSKPLKTFSSLLASFMETARSASEQRTALPSLGESVGCVANPAPNTLLNTR